MNYHYSYAAESEEGFIAMLIFYVMYALVAGGIGIALYVFRSLGVYTIAKRRGLNHPWFAWLPVADAYLLGCVSDQYRYVVKGQDKSKRKWLLGLNIVMGVLIVALVGSIIGMAFRMANQAMYGAGDARLANDAMASAMGILGFSLPLMGVSIAVAVFRFMALYDLYTSCDPRNNVVYLVLSIFFPVTEPFFIFFNRKRDEGMPPRKDTAAPGNPVADAPVWEAPAAEDTDPWKRPEQEAGFGQERESEE